MTPSAKRPKPPPTALAAKPMAIQRERVQAKAGGGQEEHADEERAGQGPEPESGGDQEGHAELGKGLGRCHQQGQGREGFEKGLRQSATRASTKRRGGFDKDLQQ